MKIIKLLGIVLIFMGFSESFGQSQNALSFDGIDDFVNCGNDASQNIQGPITIEAWIYRTDIISIYDRIIGREWETSYFLGSAFGSNSIAFGMDPNGNVNNLVITSNNVIPISTWVHVAGTWDGATLKIYLNGELSASKAYSNASVTGSSFPTYIGKRFVVSGSSTFPGILDDIRMWDVARTQLEIQDNMHKEILSPASEANLVAYYQFNEGTGQTTADLSSNSNDGVLGLDSSVGSDDPTWISSTAPLPFYSVANGNWNADATWASGQMAPSLDWAVVEINNEVTVTTDETAKDVTINSTGQMTVTATPGLAVTNQFLIMSEVSGTGSFINNGTFSATSSTVQRYYSGGEWHLISSPVQSAVSGMFTGLYLQSFDEATNSYGDIVPTSTPLTPGTGFAIWNNSNGTAEFDGLLNNNSIGSANVLSRSGAGSVNFGWNLVGNPYPSSIDWDAVSGWTKTNVDNATYRFVNGSTWATYVGGIGTNGGTQYIAPGQGFFVSVTDNGGAYPENGTLIFENGTRVHNNTPFYKDEITDLVRLQVSGNGYSDETVIRFTEDATSGYDGDLDAHKLFGFQAEAAQIYSHLDQDYGINALPEVQAVSIGVKAGQTGNFTIEATNVSEFETLILEDLLTNEISDLLESAYSFEYVQGTMDERFVLHFSPLTGVQDREDHNVFVFSSYGDLVVSIPVNQMGNVFVYSLNGQLVKTAKVNGGMNTINMDGTGAYIVKVVTDNFVKTQKVSLN